jgi:hypothetical protein
MPVTEVSSAADYARLRRRDKQVVLNDDMPEWLVERIAATEMDQKFAHLDEDE